jgi:hypothetical protein
MSPDLIESILSSINIPALLEAASNVRQTSVAVDVIKSGIDQGSYNVIIPITFGDGKIWAARIPRAGKESWMTVGIGNLMLLRKICPQIPAPCLKGVSLQETDVGPPYVFMDWINGHPLQWTPTAPARNHRRVLLDGLAACFLDLWSSPVYHPGIALTACPFQGDDLLIPRTASTWAVEELDECLLDVLESRNEPNIINILIQLSLVPTYIDHDLESLPFVLSHGDVSAANLIVNDGFEIQGILDWDLSEITPLQLAVRFPDFIVNVPGHYYPVCEDSQEDPYLEDREYFLETFRKKEIAKLGSQSLSDLLERCGDKQFFLMSFGWPNVSSEFWQRHCPWTKENLENALVELDRFLERKCHHSGNEMIAVARKQILTRIDVIVADRSND